MFTLPLSNVFAPPTVVNLTLSSSADRAFRPTEKTWCAVPVVFSAITSIDHKLVLESSNLSLTIPLCKSDAANVDHDR